MRVAAFALAALAALALAGSALAHTGGKAQPRIAAALSGEAGLARTLTVRLTDVDSGDPINGTVVRASAEMTRPHTMQTVPVRLRARGRGTYEAMLGFPMAGQWSVRVSVTGERVVSASAVLEAAVARGSAAEGSPAPLTPSLQPIVLETRIEDELSGRDYASMWSLWVHSLAALGWIVGVLVMLVALAPSVPVLTPTAHAWLSRAYRERLAWAHWGLVPLIVATGVYNMVYVTPFRLVWRPDELRRLADVPYGALYEAILVVKLGLFAALLITGTQLLLRTTRSEPAQSEPGYARSLVQALGPAGLVYLGAIPLILAAAMALRYVHVLSHVAEVIATGG